jgi:hypothetical protein
MRKPEDIKKEQARYRNHLVHQWILAHPQRSYQTYTDSDPKNRITGKTTLRLLDTLAYLQFLKKSIFITGRESIDCWYSTLLQIMKELDEFHSIEKKTVNGIGYIYVGSHWSDLFVVDLNTYRRYFQYRGGGVGCNEYQNSEICNVEFDRLIREYVLLGEDTWIPQVNFKYDF